MNFTRKMVDESKCLVFLEDKKKRNRRLVATLCADHGNNVRLKYNDGYDEFGIYHDFVREYVFDSVYAFEKHLNE